MAKRPETGHRKKFIWLNVRRQVIGQNLYVQMSGDFKNSCLTLK